MLIQKLLKISSIIAVTSLHLLVAADDDHGLALEEAHLYQRYNHNPAEEFLSNDQQPEIPSHTTNQTENNNELIEKTLRQRGAGCVGLTALSITLFTLGQVNATTAYTIAGGVSTVIAIFYCMGFLEALAERHRLNDGSNHRM